MTANMAYGQRPIPMASFFSQCVQWTEGSDDLHRDSGTLQRITQPVLVGGFTSISTLPPTERMHHATLPYNPAQEPHWYHATWYHAQRQNVLRLASHAEPNRLGVCSPCQAPQVLCGIQ